MAYDDLAIARSLWAQAAEVDVERERLTREAASAEAQRRPAVAELARAREIRAETASALTRLTSRGPARAWATLRGRRGRELARLTAEADSAETAVTVAEAHLHELVEHISRIRSADRALADADLLRAQSAAAKEKWVREGDLPAAAELDQLDKQLVATSAMASHVSTQISALAAAETQLLMARESLDVLNGNGDTRTAMSRSQITNRAIVDDVLQLLEGVRRDLRPVGIDQEPSIAAAFATEGSVRSVTRLTALVEDAIDALAPLRERAEATREHVRVETTALEWRRGQLLEQS